MSRIFKTTIRMDGNAIKELQAGIQPTDAVNVSQLEAVAGTVGEANRGANLGSGAYLYANNSNEILNFRSIKGANMKIIFAVNGNHVEASIMEANIDHNALLNYLPEEHRVIDDQGIGATDLWSAQQIMNFFQQNNNPDAENPLNYEGGYNPATNAPSNVLTGGNIESNDFYIITEAGNFYGQPVQPGYWIIAQEDEPTTASGWDIVPMQMQTVSNATTEAAGIIELATQAEVNDGTSNNTAVTPDTLHGYLDSLSLVRRIVFSPVSVGASEAPVALQHDLNNSSVTWQAYTPNDGQDVEIDVTRTSSNVLTVSAESNNVTIITVIVTG